MTPGPGCQVGTEKPMPSIAVCIATFQRAHLLERTLAALGQQTRPPDEVVVSDASGDKSGERVLRAFASRHQGIRTRWVPSERRALPWQRWWAFMHSRSDIILFLDDDVILRPRAIDALEQAYREVIERRDGEPPAGIGFVIMNEGCRLPSRDRKSFKERWLGTADCPGGTLTSGGLQVPLDPPDSRCLAPTDWLSGGAMSYPRNVLEKIGLLDRLVALYEAGIGRSEDAVLSCHARRLGCLFMILEPPAIHDSRDSEGEKPYAKKGWRLGMMATWGRAHTLRWMAVDDRAFWNSWLRMTTYELARAAANLVHRPHQLASWARIGALAYGAVRTLALWSAVPRRAKSSTSVAQLVGRDQVTLA